MLKKLQKLQFLYLGLLTLVPARRSFRQGLPWVPAGLRKLRLTLVGGTQSLIVPDLLAIPAATLTSVGLVYDSRALPTGVLLAALDSALPSLKDLTLSNSRHMAHSPSVFALLPRLACLTSAFFPTADLVRLRSENVVAVAPKLAHVILWATAGVDVTPDDVRALVGRFASVRKVVVRYKQGGQGGQEPWTAVARAALVAELKEKNVALLFREVRAQS